MEERSNVKEIDRRHKAALARAEASVAQVSAQAAQDPLRLHYHLMAPAYWVNDPCGLVEFRGEYHLFYQFNPYAPVWGHMHWGHARSRDLIHWEHLPIALAPSEPYDTHPRGGIFTGCAMADGEELKVIYCGSTGEGSDLRQVQCLAVSRDGIHFTKDADNPVIAEPPPEGSANFRDPNIWRHGGHWYMVLGTCRDGKGKAVLYRSEDMKHWEYKSVLAESDGTLGTMWECPDFFPLEDKYVLLFSPMGLGAVKGIYLVGDLDYETGRFTWQIRGEMDYGCEYYAPQTFEDSQGRRIMFGWLNSWEWMPWFQDFGPTVQQNWCGAISLPRVLSLDQTGHLRFTPVREAESLREEHFHWESAVLHPGERLIDHKAGGVSLEIALTCDLQRTTAGEFGLILRANETTGCQTVLRYITKTGELIFDRSRADGCSAQGSQCICPADALGRISFRVYVDSSCVEVYGNGGQVCMTNRIYPDAGCTQTEVYVKDGSAEIVSLDVWTLKSIWQADAGDCDPQEG